MLTVEREFRARKDRPKSYVLSGMVGDDRHLSGYHVAPRLLQPWDYSLQLKRDQRGARLHPDEASAWDLSFNTADMILVTKRLLRAARDRDPRIVGCARSFCGTIDGRNTYPYDVQGNYCQGINSWDAGHLWHEHISGLRDATEAQWRALCDVICGVPMRPAQKIRAKGGQLVRPGGTPKWPLPDGHYFGPITGPDRCHGGYYRHERAHVRAIQTRLQKFGHAPRAQGWADGRWEDPTTEAVLAWEKAKRRRPTGIVTKSDWKALL